MNRPTQVGPFRGDLDRDLAVWKSVINSIGNEVQNHLAHQLLVHQHRWNVVSAGDRHAVSFLLDQRTHLFQDILCELA
jgi:hypothetical protein